MTDVNEEGEHVRLWYIIAWAGVECCRGNRYYVVFVLIIAVFVLYLHLLGKQTLGVLGLGWC